MKLPTPRRGTEDFTRQVEWQRQIEQADMENLKRGRDIEMSDGRIILTSPDGTRYALEVDNAGALSTSAV